MKNMINSLITTILLLLTAPILVSAQFGNLFEHLFQGGGGGGGGHHGHHGSHDVPSDSSWYQNTHNGASCSLYLCPGTLACVSQPTHCPCAFPAWEEKFELSDGSAICVSKTGKQSLTAKKIELARKGLL